MANGKEKAPVVEKAADLAHVLEVDAPAPPSDEAIALVERVDVLEAELQLIRDHLDELSLHAYNHKAF